MLPDQDSHPLRSFLFALALTVFGTGQGHDVVRSVVPEDPLGALMAALDAPLDAPDFFEKLPVGGARLAQNAIGRTVGRHVGSAALSTAGSGPARAGRSLLCLLAYLLGLPESAVAASRRPRGRRMLAVRALLQVIG